MLTSDMTVIEKRDGKLGYIQIKNVEYFDVQKTFDCGQCFRFDRVEGSRHEAEFSGVAHGKHVSFAQDGDTLYIYNATLDEYKRIWERYLALDMDYRAIERDILRAAESEYLAYAAELGRGIRILRQEPYEALISFIISQNNNIPRIKGLVEALSAKCGEKIEIGEGDEEHLSGKSSLCAFPDAPSVMSLGIQGLADLKTGFRAKYIYDACEKIMAGEISLAELYSPEITTDECISELCKIKGVGPKVANCVTLFGLEKYDSFPIDVWIKKVGERHFSGEEFSAARFGKYAGIAQQWLFYAERPTFFAKKVGKENLN